MHRNGFTADRKQITFLFEIPPQKTPKKPHLFFSPSIFTDWDFIDFLVRVPIAGQ